MNNKKINSRESFSVHSAPNRWEIARRVGLVVAGVLVVIGTAAMIAAFYFPLGSIVLYAAYGGGGAALLGFCALALSYCCWSCKQPSTVLDSHSSSVNRNSVNNEDSVNDEESDIDQWSVDNEESDIDQESVIKKDSVNDEKTVSPQIFFSKFGDFYNNLTLNNIGNGVKDVGNTVGDFVWKTGASAVQNLGNLINGPGVIQKRTYFYLFEGIVDGLIRYLDKGRRSNSSLSYRIDLLMQLVKLPYSSSSLLVYGQIEQKDNFYFHYQKLFDILCYLPSCSNDDYAKIRYEFFYCLNQAFELMNQCREEDKQKLVQQIGYLLFTGVSVQGYGNNLLFKELNLDKSVHDTDDQHFKLSDLVKSDRVKIANASRLKEIGATHGFTLANQVNGEYSILFAPNEVNNFGSTLYRTIYSNGSDSHQVLTIRYGTPTAESLKSRPQAIPSFRLFLEECQARKEKIVALQHQSPFNVNELARLQVMDDLAEEYPNTFYVFRFPMDGDFFMQPHKSKTGENYVTKYMKVDEFKKELLASLMRNKNGILLPPINQLSISSEQLEKELKDILDHIHETFFPTTHLGLNVTDRQVFQLLTYVYLGDYFTLLLGARFRSSQCKDTLDRSMTINVLAYYLHLLRTGQQSDSEQLMQLRTMVNAYGLMVKNIPMNKQRFDLLCAGLDVLGNSHVNVCNEKIVVNDKEWSLSNVAFETAHHQELNPLPSEARTSKEYHEALQREKNREIQTHEIPFFFKKLGKTSDAQQIEREFIAGRVPLKMGDREIKAKKDDTYENYSKQCTETFGLPNEEVAELLHLSTYNATMGFIAEILTRRHANDTLGLIVNNFGNMVGVKWVKEKEKVRYVEAYCALKISYAEPINQQPELENTNNLISNVINTTQTWANSFRNTFSSPPLPEPTIPWPPKDLSLYAKIRIDRETGNAVVSWKAPSEKQPKDIQDVINDLDKMIEDLKNDGKTEKH